MEKHYKKTREILFDLEEKIDADHRWMAFGCSLWWMIHFRLFNQILARLASGEVTLGQPARPRKLLKQKRFIVNSLISFKAFLARSANLFIKDPVVFVTSQTTFQKIYDPRKGRDVLADPRIDFVKEHLQKNNRILIFEMMTMANKKNILRSIFKRELSTMPDIYFDFLASRSPQDRVQLEDIEIPALWQDYVTPQAMTVAKRDIEERATRINILIRLFTKIRPKAVIATDENGAARDYVIAANTLNIPTFALQHGIIHEFHPNYIYPRWAKNVALPSKTFLFGDFYKKLLTEQSVYTEDRLVVAGQPRLSRLRNSIKNADTSSFRRRYSIPEPDRLVVFTTQPYGRGYKKELDTVFSLLAQTKNTFLVVKLHPGELEDNFYNDLARRHGFPTSKLLCSRAIDLYFLTLASDRFISIMSTTIAEAIVLGAQVGMLDISNSPDRYMLKGTSLVSVIKNDDDFMRFLESGNTMDARERADFTELHYNGSLREDSDRTIADAIERQIAGHP